ncbi:MAG: glycosyltransferase [Clostridia bacterium]|nr:glycosyltransferase [Clostridia bacterium]
MSDQNKLVSIIIPTYKRPDTLARAINSAINQTYRPIEIFVVDDNDPDTEGRKLTEELMKQYENEPLVTYLQHEKNKNGSAARNTGARHSKGEYLAFLDDDDEYLPGKIKAQVERLEGLDESWGACYCRYYRKNGDKLVSRSTEKREGYVNFHELCRNFWHGGGTGPMVRRSVFEAVGGFDESFHRNQDYEYMLKITKRYKLAFVNTFGQINYVDSFHERKRTYEEILENFKNTFKKDIDELSPEQKKKFDKMIALQTYRHYLFSKHDLKKAVKTLKENRVGLFSALRYTAYLVYRKVFKISCGYNI